MSENNSIQNAENLIEAAHSAFRDLAHFDQNKIDRICEAMSNAALRDSARLGKLAVDETGFGIADDKREKNRFAAQDVWNYFRDLKTVGVLRETKDIVEIASPRGVVAAIIPSTNPTSTTIFKAIISIKSRNPVVFSPHPSAVKCINETARILREAAAREGLPHGAISCLPEATIEATEILMKHSKTAVILATGGIGLVRAAYSSGKPAFGVGPGNVPVFIEKSANIAKAVNDILTGTCFDNGTICASEQSVVVEKSIAATVREQFKLQGAYFPNESESERIGKVLVTEKRTLNPSIVGKSAAFIANLAGVTIPKNTRCLIADCHGVGRDFPWSIEKLSPTLAFFIVDDMEAAARRCFEILQYGGMGHTAGIHTGSRDAAIAFGEKMPASRICVNTPTTHGAIGFSTALTPSMTLGCGSWGGNVTSDNVSPLHLLDIKRVAFETKTVKLSRETNVDKTGDDKRKNIATLVDNFLSRNSSSNGKVEIKPEKVSSETPLARIINLVNPEKVEKKVSSVVQKVVSHEKPISSQTNGAKPATVDFVSEDDVKKALEKNEKIYVTPRTIITPSARDAGEPHEIFIKLN
ncbi:MAG: aldehyde dehydrogenase family protein [Pyrinomonadaceae bacterium]|nr:aldehyde dehydrogenase family protein [Pyrinomonadaceae bacterium]